jgi:SPP1 gp7 family putative phage head morphogenesis protein
MTSNTLIQKPLRLVVNQYDPTRTLTLRSAFAKNMNGRFNALNKAIRQAVVAQDCFGLQPQVFAELNTPMPRAFDFPRSQDKIAAFMQWLRQQEQLGILETATLSRFGSGIEDVWTDIYIMDSYKRGIIRARQELRKAGYDVPDIDASGGIEAVMGGPFHVDRVGVLYTRVFESLKGITSQMDAQISQVLAQGLIDGDSAAFLARKLVATINGTNMGELGITDSLGRFIPAKRRAEMLARTEIIRAHHLANIQEYKNWGALGVTVIAEWSTAGDDRVCPVCEIMQGNKYTLQEIEGMIPAHVLCRCMAIPVIKQ